MIFTKTINPDGTVVRTRSPSITASVHTMVRPGRLHLPGTELTKLISWFADVPSDHKTCSCKTLAKEMDRNGVAWCQTNRDSYIVPKMLQNREALSDELKRQKGWKGVLAKAAGTLPEPLLRFGAGQLVDLACRNTDSKKKNNRNTSPPVVWTPLVGEPRLTLVFHVWPYGDAWKRHAEKLQSHIHRFSRKLLGIAVDDTTASVDSVLDVFGSDWEVFTARNDLRKRKGLREVATYQLMFPHLWQEQNDITFCLHGKGSQNHTANSEAVSWWTDAMYATVYHNLDEVVNMIANGKSIVGSFRKKGKFLNTTHRWHYSGTFYAFRNIDAFRGGLPEFQKKWWGTEAWPGDHFPYDSSACVFGDNAGDLYDAGQQPRSEFEKWKAYNGFTSIKG